MDTRRTVECWQSLFRRIIAWFISRQNLAATGRIIMKITAVTPLVLGTPWRNLTFVKVDTDEGIYGLGEVRMNNRTNALLGYLRDAIPRYAIGLDPFDIETLTSGMMIHDYGRMGEVTMSAVSLLAS